MLILTKLLANLLGCFMSVSINIDIKKFREKRQENFIEIRTSAVTLNVNRLETIWQNLEHCKRVPLKKSITVLYSFLFGLANSQKF